MVDVLWLSVSTEVLLLVKGFSPPDQHLPLSSPLSSSSMTGSLSFVPGSDSNISASLVELSDEVYPSVRSVMPLYVSFTPLTFFSISSMVLCS